MFPASVLAKRLGVKAGAIKSLMHSGEWHHTSKYFNMTDYYSEDDAIEMLDELKAWRAAATKRETFKNCSGSYLEWSGTRNHPRAEKVIFKCIWVTRKGKWFTLHFPDGQVRKNENTRGFELRDGSGKRLTFN